MKPEAIHPGLILRVIPHGIVGPVGTLATVKAGERRRSGDWVVMIEYDETKQARYGTRFYRAHLWTVDLAYFEIVRDVERTVAKQARKGEARREAKRAQLKVAVYR